MADARLQNLFLSRKPNPVAKLPTELLILVFKFIVHSGNWIWHHKSRTTLTLISRRFQAIIHSTPSLWTVIVIHKQLPWTVSTVSLARSRDLPLDVVLYLSDAPAPIRTGPSLIVTLSRFQEVCAHLHRWRSVAFRFDCLKPDIHIPTSSAPLLQSLKITVDRRSLSIPDINGVSYDANIPWFSTLSGLRDLELNLDTWGPRLNLADLTTILIASPALSSLKLRHIKISFPPPTHPQIHAHLRELRAIYMDLPPIDTQYLLQHIHAPLCRTFHITCWLHSDRTETQLPRLMSTLVPLIPKIKGPCNILCDYNDLKFYARRPGQVLIHLRGAPVLTSLRHFLPNLSPGMLLKNTRASIRRSPAANGQMPEILRLISASGMHVTRLEGIRDDHVVETLTDPSVLPALRRLFVDIRRITPGLLSPMVTARAELRSLKVRGAQPQHNLDNVAIQNIAGLELVWKKSKVSGDWPPESKWKRSVFTFFSRNYESYTHPFFRARRWLSNRLPG